MRFLEGIAIGAGAAFTISCAAPTQTERRDTETSEQSDRLTQRRPAEIALPEATELDPATRLIAGALAKKVEACVDDKGGRMGFTFAAGRRGIIVEKVRPTLRSPVTGIRLGEYVICQDGACGDFRTDPAPRNPSDSFGAGFDSYGLQTHRYVDAKEVTMPHVADPEIGADGKPELTLDFSRIDYRFSSPDAVCVPLPQPRGGYLHSVVVEDRPAAISGAKAYTERFLCQTGEVTDAERLRLNERYIGVLRLTADACRSGRVEVPGSRILNRPPQGAPPPGLGVIDTGTGSSRSN